MWTQEDRSGAPGVQSCFLKTMVERKSPISTGQRMGGLWWKRVEQAVALWPEGAESTAVVGGGGGFGPTRLARIPISGMCWRTMEDSLTRPLGALARFRAAMGLLVVLLGGPPQIPRRGFLQRTGPVQGLRMMYRP